MNKIVDILNTMIAEAEKSKKNSEGGMENE